eukprot:31067-Pelagococcus_subviridis.AAC.2
MYFAHPPATRASAATDASDAFSRRYAASHLGSDAMIARQLFAPCFSSYASSNRFRTSRSSSSESDGRTSVAGGAASVAMTTTDDADRARRSATMMAKSIPCSTLLHALHGLVLHLVHERDRVPSLAPPSRAVRRRRGVAHVRDEQRRVRQNRRRRERAETPFDPAGDAAAAGDAADSVSVSVVVVAVVVAVDDVLLLLLPPRVRDRAPQRLHEPVRLQRLRERVADDPRHLFVPSPSLFDLFSHLGLVLLRRLEHVFPLLLSRRELALRVVAESVQALPQRRDLVRGGRRAERRRALLQRRDLVRGGDRAGVADRRRVVDVVGVGGVDDCSSPPAPKRQRVPPPPRCARLRPLASNRVLSRRVARLSLARRRALLLRGARVSLHLVEKFLSPRRERGALLGQRRVPLADAHQPPVRVLQRLLPRRVRLERAIRDVPRRGRGQRRRAHAVEAADLDALHRKRRSHRERGRMGSSLTAYGVSDVNATLPRYVRQRNSSNLAPMTSHAHDQPKYAVTPATSAKCAAGERLIIGLSLSATGIGTPSTSCRRFAFCTALAHAPIMSSAPPSFAISFMYSFMRSSSCKCSLSSSMSSEYSPWPSSSSSPSDPGLKNPAPPPEALPPPPPPPPPPPVGLSPGAAHPPSFGFARVFASAVTICASVFLIFSLRCLFRAARVRASLSIALCNIAVRSSKLKNHGRYIAPIVPAPPSSP